MVLSTRRNYEEEGMKWGVEVREQALPLVGSSGSGNTLWDR